MHLHGFNWLKPILQEASVDRTNDDILPYHSVGRDVAESERTCHHLDSHRAEKRTN